MIVYTNLKANILNDFHKILRSSIFPRPIKTCDTKKQNCPCRKKKFKVSPRPAIRIILLVLKAIGLLALKDFGLHFNHVIKTQLEHRSANSVNQASDVYSGMS